MTLTVLTSSCRYSLLDVAQLLVLVHIEDVHVLGLAGDSVQLSVALIGSLLDPDGKDLDALVPGHGRLVLSLVGFVGVAIRDQHQDVSCPRTSSVLRLKESVRE